ncbi:MAG: hypothetical protein U1E56_02155 [Bauldia sp.]
MAFIIEITDIPSDQFAVEAHKQMENGAVKVEKIVQADGLLTLRATYSDDAAESKASPDMLARVTGASRPMATRSADTERRLPRSLSGHGTFFYNARATIAEYGSVQNTVDALRRAGMQHAWVRIHGTHPHGPGDGSIVQELVGALEEANIAVAGWGWCQGANAVSDAKMAIRELRRYGLSDYVADIEHGTNNAQWTSDEVKEFCAAVRDQVDGGFAISTYPLIDWHNPELMTAALEFVDAFAPQIYWFNFPNRRMVDQFQKPSGGKYPQNQAGAYVDLCLDRWVTLMGARSRPLVATGQAYWGEGNTEAEANAKLAEFLNNWNGFQRIAGLNWWHFGGGGAMSHAMFEAIVAADLGNKQYES